MDMYQELCGKRPSRERYAMSRWICHMMLAWRTGPQPAVSLASFIWAHCLVRSRALDLQLGGGTGNAATPGGSGGAAQLGLCMIPLLDLANHRSGPAATCTVRLRVRPGGNRYVKALATRRRF